MKQKDKNAGNGVLVPNRGKTKTEIQKLFGTGTNWSSPKRAVGNAIESTAANSVASYLNAAGTVL